MPRTLQSKPNNKARHQEEVVIACLEALSRGGGQELSELLPQIIVLRDPRFLPPLLAMLRSNRIRERELAAIGLAELDTPETRKALCDCLHEKPVKISPGYQRFQFAILQSVGRIGCDQAVPCLQSLLHSRKGPWANPKWKEKVVDAIGQVAQQGGKKALAALMEIAQSKDSQLAADALQEMCVAFWHCPNSIPKRVFDLLIHRLCAKDETIKKAAWEALEDLDRLGCRRAEKMLLSLSC